MGWTYTYRQPRRYTDRQWFEEQFGEQFAPRIKDTATKGGVFYAVIEIDAEKEKRLVPDENGKVRCCIVVLTKWDRRAADGYNYGWKDMDEFMGPCEAECPERLLNMLSPFKEGVECYAIDWRRKCWEAIARRKLAPKLRDGLPVKLRHPIRFTNGKHLDSFIVRAVRGRRGKTVYRFENGGIYYSIRTRARVDLVAA